jgi:hypothetical protein
MVQPMTFSARPNTDKPIQLANAFALPIGMVMIITIHSGAKIKT